VAAEHVVSLQEKYSPLFTIVAHDDPQSSEKRLMPSTPLNPVASGVVSGVPHDDGTVLKAESITWMGIVTAGSFPRIISAV